MTPVSIAEANDLERGEALTPGEKLIIPAARPSRRPSAVWCAIA